MKTPSNDLFLLIKSLTKSERRYFRQFAARHIIGEQNQYLSLFEAIDAQKEYDESALKLSIEGTSYAKYLAVAKQYLQEQILESLHLFHQYKDPEEKIKKQLHLSKVLIQKKLLEQAERLLKKTRRLMEKQAAWECGAELIATERKLKRSQKALNTKNVETSYQTLTVLLEKQAIHNQYWFLSQQIMAAHLENIKVNQAEKKVLLDQVARQLLAMGLPTDAVVKIDYYKALATYHFMNGDVAEAAKYNQQLLNLFDNSPDLVEAEREQYIAVFNNYLIDNHILGNYELLEAGVARLRKLPEQTLFKSIPNLNIKVLELTYSLQLNARIAQKEFESALELLPDLEREMELHQKSIALNYLLSFHYLRAYIYFMNGSYGQTLDCIESLKSPLFKDMMRALQLATDRLLLLTHYELGNYLLLENLLQSTRRAHRQLKVKSALEDCLFKYLKKLSVVTNAKESTGLRQKLKVALLELKASEPNAWEYFDFEYWLDNSVKV